MRHFIYLHGFASSPRSSKIRFFRERLGKHDVDLHAPDLNAPEFSTLTLTRTLDHVEALVDTLPPGPLVLLGSSLGAGVALQVAARPPCRDRVDRLVLLAPALDFDGTLQRELGDDQLRRWRETGTLEVFHHGYGEPRTVGFALYEDASRYDALSVDVRVPTLVFQGARDETVDPDTVVRFARGRPAVTLRVLDDDHRLLESLDAIWRETETFLGFE